MFESLSQLPDGELLRRLHHLVARRNERTAQLVAHIGEVDARKLYADEACPSMFAWCTTVLGLSESAAYKRIAAARVAREYPVVLDALAAGRLHLTAVAMLRGHLTPDNHLDLIEAASGKSKRDLERLLADRSPRPDAPTKIRKQPAPRAPSQGAAGSPADAGTSGGSEVAVPRRIPSGETMSPFTRGPASRVEPLGQQRYRVQFTASEAWTDKLRQARDLLSHRIPDGDVVEVLDQALTLLVDRALKERFAVLQEAERARSKDPGSTTTTRRIPNAIKRQVFHRDGGRCTFVDAHGRRCGEARFIEFHHLRAWARGGDHAADNLTLRCRAHNLHAARQDFGVAHIAAKSGVQTSLLGWKAAPG